MNSSNRSYRYAVLPLVLASIPAGAICPLDEFAAITDFSHADFETARTLDEFGTAMATNGDVIAVGLPQNGHSTTDVGNVYLFQRDAASGQWPFLRKLSEPGFSEPGDQFGGALAMQGDTLVVGAVQAGDESQNDAGAVYVFARNQGGPDQWGVRQSIIGLENDGLTSFGESIAIDGDRMLVGDSEAGSPDVGRVIVYERADSMSNFNPVAELLAPAGDDGIDFARRVALDGDTAVVSDEQFDAEPGGSLEGRVYVYARNPDSGQWGLVKHLALPQEATVFGTAIGISDDRIAVGARVTGGHVFLFERHAGGPDNWGQIADLTAGIDSGTADDFGFALDLHSNELLVGAANGVGVDNSTGAAYVFRRDAGGPDQWGQVQKLFSQTNNINSKFGEALDWAAGVAAIGDPNSDHPDFSAGARVGRAYVYYNDVIFCDPFE